MKKSLVICLSLLIVGCSNNLPGKPDGWHCTYKFDPTTPSINGFYCNQILNPNNKLYFSLQDASIDKAQCMPLETFERYSAYVEELKRLAAKQCPNIH